MTLTVLADYWPT